LLFPSERSADWTQSDQRIDSPSCAPHSEGREFPQIEKYRGIVEEVVFQWIGRPAFFDQAVEMVMGRIAARIDQRGIPHSKSTSCAFAPQEGRIRQLAHEEAVRLKREIARQFVKTGRL